MDIAIHIALKISVWLPLHSIGTHPQCPRTDFIIIVTTKALVSTGIEKLLIGY